MSALNAIKVIALGMGPQDLGQAARQEIARAQVLAGGQRLLDMFPDHPGKRLPFEAGLSAFVDNISGMADEYRVVVLVSGDSGFFSLAGTLANRLGSHRVRLFPNVSSIQAAFSRIQHPWQDAALISLHARGLGHLWPAVRTRDWIGILTDPKHSPDVLARLMLQRDQLQWRMWVFENMGADDEHHQDYSLDEAALKQFAPLNVVILERLEATEILKLGATEDAYVHENGLITKAEVRAAALSCLDLEPGQIMWDLGAGSGSVGLEACLLLGHGKVVAVERRPERIKQVRSNRARFGVGNLQVVEADLPQGLDELPPPDRVFIGGGGKNLRDIVARSVQLMKPGGRVVAAVVRLESLTMAREAMQQAGLSVRTIHMQVSRGEDLAGEEYLKALNPVYLISGFRQAAT